MQLFTKKGYVLAAVVSSMQKAIRRGDAKMATFWASEMWRSGYDRYAWRRLLIISAEDVYGVITMEVAALHYAYLVLNDHREGEGGGQLMVAKAAYLLARAQKSREIDNFVNLVMVDGLGITDEEIQADLATYAGEEFKPDVPQYMWDYHSPQGRKKGKTRESFIKDEHYALRPLMPGLFDHLVELAGQKGPTADPPARGEQASLLDRPAKKAAGR
jgi:replication-associated recombination protein RarA